MKYRLTENKLRGIIREAVKGMLSELDWKTYASAAEKQHRKGLKKINGKYDTGREDRFKKAAADAFNRVYGMNYDDGNDYLNPSSNSYRMMPKGSEHFNEDPEISLTTRTVGNRNDNGRYDDEYHTFQKGGFPMTYPNLRPYHRSEQGYGWDGNHRSGYNPEFIDTIDDDLRAAQIKGNQEIDDYINGNYEYQKGKGWARKDESINRRIDRIVRESLRRNLH